MIEVKLSGFYISKVIINVMNVGMEFIERRGVLGKGEVLWRLENVNNNIYFIYVDNC